MNPVLRVIQIPVLYDNYAYLVVCEKTSSAAIIDTPDAEIILNCIKTNNLKPVAILNTHHHDDHAGGNAEILGQYDIPVYASDFDKNRIDGVSHVVGEGSVVKVGDLEFVVLDTPGHTLGHVSYFCCDALFCGDTLFSGGCGRLFEGTPEQMFASLKKISDLPDNTQIYCAHEYTQSNLEFALTVEPQNSLLKEKIDLVADLRNRNKATVPTLLGEEKSYNPFLRCASAEIRRSLKITANDADSDVFRRLRAMKDGFRA